MAASPNTPVCVFRKQLLAEPELLSVPGIELRAFRDEDVDRWLALRRAAFVGETPAARDWSADEFAAEMLAKAWWRPERTWLAAAEDNPNRLVGAVTLAERIGDAKRVPVVHWLMVDPAWRRRGIGSLLMSRLERAAWEAGWREIELETHAEWNAAVVLYRKLGYERVACSREA